MYENKKQKLDYLLESLNKVLIKKYDNYNNRFIILKGNYILNNPEILFKDKKIKFVNLIEKLELINPLNLLKKGFSIVSIDNKIINNIKDIKEKDVLNIKLSNGIVNAEVNKIEEKNYE